MYWKAVKTDSGRFDADRDRPRRGSRRGCEMGNSDAGSTVTAVEHDDVDRGGDGGAVEGTLPAEKEASGDGK